MSYCNSSHLYQLEEYSDLQVVTREQKAKPALESTSEKVQQVSICCSCIGFITAWAKTEAGLYVQLMSHVAMSKP